MNPQHWGLSHEFWIFWLPVENCDFVPPDCALCEHFLHAHTNLNIDFTSLSVIINDCSDNFFDIGFNAIAFCFAVSISLHVFIAFFFCIPPRGNNYIIIIIILLLLLLCSCPVCMCVFVCVCPL